VDTGAGSVDAELESELDVSGEVSSGEADVGDSVDDPLDAPESDPGPVELEERELTAVRRASRPSAGSCPLTSTPNMSSHTAMKAQSVAAATVRRIRFVTARWARSRASPIMRALGGSSERVEVCARLDVGSKLILVTIWSWMQKTESWLARKAKRVSRPRVCGG
jgi:hypothetical protein